MRAFGDGHQEEWWALEVEAGPYGPEKAQRAFVLSTDPERLPRLGTWYLTTNLPAPGHRLARETGGQPLLAAASVAEVVRLYGLRMWVEQSYKQVKHALGWSAYQVRTDTAIRRHWQLVCCAFSFCWWAYGRLPTDEGEQSAEHPEGDLPAWPARKERKQTLVGVLAGGVEGGEGVAGTVGDAVALLESVLRSAQPTELRALLELVYSGQGLHLYVR